MYSYLVTENKIFQLVVLIASYCVWRSAHVSLSVLMYLDSENITLPHVTICSSS